MRKIDEKAMPFLKEKGYGKGTNYTTDLVASLMVQFAEKQGQELPIHDVSKWVAVKDALPLVDTFYLVASSNLQNWTKALYKNGEFHTIENIIDWNITHWRYIKPPCC